MKFTGLSPLLLIYFIVWCSAAEEHDILSLLRSDKGDFCITNSSSLMYYTASTFAVGEETKLIPESPYFCDFRNNDKENDCSSDFGKYWTKVNSLDYENIPIFDMRWEGLAKEKFYKKNTVQELFSIKNSNNFKITLSVRAEQMNVLFCDEKYINYASCYKFVLQGWSGKYSFLIKCIQQISTTGGNSINTICTDVVKISHSDLDERLFSMKKWTHITFEKYGRKLILREAMNQEDFPIMKYEDTDEFIDIKYMFGGSDTAGYYKIHKYDYIRNTIEHKDLIDSSNHIGNVVDHKICFSMHLTTCQKCSISVVAYSITSTLGSSKFKIIDERKLQPSYGVWTDHKIIFTNVTDYTHFQIGFRTTTTSWTFDRFWSIGAFRYCSPVEYRVSTLQGKKLKNCQLLNSSNKIEWKTSTITPNITCGSLNRIGELCIPCEVLTNNSIVSSCQKIKMCEKISDQESCFCSPGYIGSECEKACQKGTFGYGCQQKCGNCLKGTTCAVENGFCTCDILYEGPTCRLQRFGTSELITSNSTSCTIQLLKAEQFEGDTILVQYKEDEAGYVYHYWKNSKRNSRNDSIIKVEDLEANSNYFIRILLTRNFSNIGDLQNAEIPYTPCSTTCNAWSGSEIEIKPEEDTVNFQINLSKDKCRVTSYKWMIFTENGDILNNGNASESFSGGTLPVFTRLEVVFYGSNNISKYFRTDEGVPEPPNDLDVYWHKNNTIEISWNNPSKINGILRDFEIEVYINNFHPMKFSYKDESNLNQEPYHFYINESFLPSSDVKINVFTLNTKKNSKPSEKITSSYPSKLYFNKRYIETRNITKSTITLHMDVKIDGDKIEKNDHYFFVLITDPDNENKDENVKKLENILGEPISNDTQLRLRAQFNLGRDTSIKFDLILGEHPISRSDLLNADIKNEPLEEGQRYKIIVLAVHEYKKKFRFVSCDLNVSTLGKPRMIPRHGNEESDSYAFLLLLLLVPITAVLVIYRKRIYQALQKISLEKLVNFENYNLVWFRQNNEVLILESKEPSSRIINVLRGGTNRSMPSKSTNPPNPQETIYSKPVKVANLEEYVKEAIASGELIQQHSLFPRTQTQPCLYGSKVENKCKNRYLNLIAYDHSRVKLVKLPGDENSDYINANYIHGYRVPNAFIATQGPKHSTLGDFWRMIWQENTRHIIALANVYEGGKKKVEQYWPNINEELNIMNISIKYISVEIFADFEYRKFEVAHENETRKLEQLHFTSWPDHGVPLYPQSLVPFLRKILRIKLSSSSPVVIHCSAGVGRTGTILLSDICLRMAAKEGVVDILNHLQQLREQRSNMVDNVEQYKLVHLVILESLMGLHTSIPCEIVEETVKKLMDEKEYKIQMDYLIETQWQDDAMKSVRQEEKEFVIYPEKNRFQGIVPDSETKIFLTKYPSNDPSSSYINAVRVDGFRCPGRFIVTQQPMPNTLSDFWRLVIEQGTNVIISLNEINIRDETCCQFIPTAKNREIRPVDFMSVTFDKMVKLKNYDIYTVRVHMKKSTKQKFDVDIITFKGWPPASDLPSSCEEFLAFWEEADTISRRSQTILVTCYDGRKASGVYVALCFVIEKIKLEQECDVCLAVRNVRHNRKQFIAEESQFVFLYEAAIRFINGFESYANFKSQ